MAAITTNDLKNGMTLDLADGLFQVVEFQHVKPGKGGAFVRTTLQERAHRRRGRPHVPGRREGRAGHRSTSGRCSTCTATATTTCSWTTTTYDQLNVDRRRARRRRQLPRRGLDRRCCRCTATRSSASSCPAAVELDGHRDRAGHAGRPGVGRPQAGHPRDRPRRAGAAVRQPGDRLKVDTRSGEYITRA